MSNNDKESWVLYIHQEAPPQVLPSLLTDNEIGPTSRGAPRHMPGSASIKVLLSW